MKFPICEIYEATHSPVGIENRNGIAEVTESNPVDGSPVVVIFENHLIILRNELEIIVNAFNRNNFSSYRNRCEPFYLFSPSMCTFVSHSPIHVHLCISSPSICTFVPHLPNPCAPLYLIPQSMYTFVSHLPNPCAPLYLILPFMYTFISHFPIHVHFRLYLIPHPYSPLYLFPDPYTPLYLIPSIHIYLCISSPPSIICAPLYLISRIHVYSTISTSIYISYPSSSS